jgi:hypothetical protein
MRRLPAARVSPKLVYSQSLPTRQQDIKMSLYVFGGTSWGYFSRVSQAGMVSQS